MGNGRITMKQKNRFRGVFDLKPCPFCGNEKTIFVEEMLYDKGHFLAKCLDCYAATDQTDTPEEAAEKWNDYDFSEVTIVLNQDDNYIQNEDPWLELKNAIVTNEFNTYKATYKNMLKSWRNQHSYEKYKEGLENQKPWFFSEDLRLLTNLDGGKLIETAQAQAIYEYFFRDKHRCDKRISKRVKACDSCPHKRKIWWLWARGNEYDNCHIKSRKERIA